jgi:hypothetical protein
MKGRFANKHGTIDSNVPALSVPIDCSKAFLIAETTATSQIFHKKRNIIEMKVGILNEFLILFKYAFLWKRTNFTFSSLTHLRTTNFFLEIKYRTKLWNNNLHSIKMIQFTLNILQEMTMRNAKVLSPVVLTACRPLLIYKFEELSYCCLSY